MPDRTGSASNGGCLDAEVLSAYIDGNLDARERAAVEAHLASCADCYEIMSEVLRIQEEMLAAGADDAEPMLAERPAVDATPDVSSMSAAWTPARDPRRDAPVPRPDGETRVLRGVFSRRTAVWAVVGGVLAAAAALVLVVRLQPTWWTGGVDPKLADLVEAVGEERTVEARLTGGFKYGPLRSPVRSGGRSGPTDNWALLAAAGRIREVAEKDPTPENLHALGVAQLQLGEFDEAITTLEGVKGAATSPAVLTDLSAAYLARSTARNRPGDLPRALETAEQAVSLAPDLVLARFNRALALERLRLEEAARAAWADYLARETNAAWTSEAKEHLNKLNEGAPPQTLLPPLPTSPACLQEVSDLQRQGRMGEIWASIEKCGNQAMTADSAAWVAYFGAIGQYYLGNHEAAEMLALKAASLADKQGGRVVAARATSFLAGLQFVRGAYEPALVLATRATERLDAVGDGEGRASSRQLTAEILVALGEGDESWRHYLAALDVGRSGLHGIRRYALFNSLALAGLSQGYPWLSIEALSAAEGAASGPSHAALLTEINLNRARSWNQLGLLERASDDLAAAAANLAVVSDGPIRSRLSAELGAARAEVFQYSAPEMAVAASDIALEHYSRLGVQFREAGVRLTKARALLALERPEAAERELRAGVELIESERAFVEQRRLRVSHLDRAWDLYRDLARLLVDTGREREALLLYDGGRSRRSAVQSRSGPGAGDVRPQRPGELLLVYMVDESSIDRWAVTSTGIEFQRKHLSRSLDAAIESLREDAIAHGLERTEASKEVGELLLSGLPVGVDALKRLVVVPDGPIAQVPFSAIVLPQDGRLVVDVVSVAMASSLESYATSVRALAERPVVPQSAVVFAPSAPDGRDLPALPGAVRESRAISRLYPNADFVEGLRATGLRFTDALRTASVVHFAGHAISDPIDPWNSRLLLAPSEESPRGFWRPSAEHSTPIAAVTVLAACSTAVGPARRGEGVISLATALLTLGAPAVVATLWDVPDEEMERLFVAFHQGLLRGESPADSLRRAQLKARSEGGATHWAAVVAIGS